jgi:rhodanese-related sulfurtransferase
MVGREGERLEVVVNCRFGRRSGSAAFSRSERAEDTGVLKEVMLCMKRSTSKEK